MALSFCIAAVQRTLSLTVLVVGLASALLAYAQPAADHEDPWPGWDEKEMKESVTDGFKGEFGEIDAVQILAWNTWESEKSGKNHSALMWFRTKSPVLLPTPKRWGLFVMNRQPPEHSWSEGATRSTDHWQMALELFQSPPGTSEVYEFLRESEDFVPGRGARVTSGAIRKDIWRQFVGEPPAQLPVGE